MNHFIEQILDVEVALQTVEQVDFVGFLLGVEPSVSEMRSHDYRNTKLPHLKVRRQEVDQRLEVIFRPIVLKTG